MKKTLIVIAHPDIHQSVINQRWLEELKRYPEQFTVRQLYALYPDGNIDVSQEQKLIETHDHLVLQFPLYWFNLTPLLKTWLDKVFTEGWAYGPAGNHLTHRPIALAVTAGIREEDFKASGRYHYTLEEILRPLETTFLYCQADYRSFFAFYGAEYQPTPEIIEQSARDYVQFLERL